MKHGHFCFQNCYNLTMRPILNQLYLFIYTSFKINFQLLFYELHLGLYYLLNDTNIIYYSRFVANENIEGYNFWDWALIQLGCRGERDLSH